MRLVLTGWSRKCAGATGDHLVSVDPDNPSVSQGEEKFLPAVAETHNYLPGIIGVVGALSGTGPSAREKRGKKKAGIQRTRLIALSASFVVPRPSGGLLRTPKRLSRYGYGIYPALLKRAVAPLQGLVTVAVILSLSIRRYLPQLAHWTDIRPCASWETTAVCFGQQGYWMIPLIWSRDKAAGSGWFISMPPIRKEVRRKKQGRR